MITTEFLRFARSAAAHKLEYLVIGGLALNLHKILRNTIDSDIWLNPTPANVNALGHVIREMGYGEDEIESILALNLKEPNVFQLEGPIDILTHVHRDFEFEDCFQRAFFSPLEEDFIPVLSLDDLRELKVRVRRDQDLRDILLIDEHLKMRNDEHKKGGL